MFTVILALLVITLGIYGGKFLKPFYDSILTLIVIMYRDYWCIPRRIHKIMKEQQVPGPSLVTVIKNSLDKFFMRGNSIHHHVNHNIVGRLFPHYVTWAANYGRRFFFSNWIKPKICFTEANQMKELLFEHRTSRLQQQVTKHFIGHRLLMKIGLDRLQRRHVLQTVYQLSRIQEWVGNMAECSQITIQLLQHKVEQLGGDGTEIEISQCVNILTAAVMSRSEFGCSSEQGMRITRVLNQFQQMRCQSSWHSWISRNSPFPSRYNRELKALQVELEKLLVEMIMPRVEYVAIARTNSHGNDLLGMLLNEMHKKFGFVNVPWIVEECKTSFFAGHEATTLLITWTLMLLACNTNWQDLVRDEVKDMCDGNLLTAQNIRRCTLLNNVIKESLRLYPPVPVIDRMVCEDTRLRDGLLIPKGVSTWFPVIAINHSEGIWGEDAHEFNPERFSSDDLTAEARRHYLPFSAGPHHCPAQYYALMEAKIFIAMFLSKFSFTISQNYTHEPIVVTRLKPKYGVQINVTNIRP